MKVDDTTPTQVSGLNLAQELVFSDMYARSAPKPPQVHTGGIVR
jgi:hypothetical protein